MDSPQHAEPNASHPKATSRPANRRLIFERLAEITHEVFYHYLLTPSRGFDFINPAVKAVIGYAPEEFYQDEGLFIRIIYLDDRELIRHAIEGNQPDQPVLTRWVHKDGNLVWVEQYIIPILDSNGRITSLEGMARPVQPPSQVGELREIPQQRKRLLEISQSMIASFSLDEVIRHIIQALSDMLAYDSCVFSILAQDSNLFQILERVKNELRTHKIKVGILRPENKAEMKILTSGKPDLVYAEHKMMIPIRLQDTALGVFSLYRNTGAPLNYEEFELAQLCLAYASLAIENAHLCRESQTRADLITRLVPKNENLNHPFSIAEVADSIAQEGLSISLADRLAIYSHNAGNRLNRLWSKGLSFAYLNHVLTSHTPLLEHRSWNSTEIDLTTDTWELETDSSIRLLSEAEGFRGIAVCPLVYAKKSIANVTLYYNEPHQWTAREIEALELYSRQAAAALENTRLYEELEETYFQTVLTLAKAIDARDSYTADHSRRLADWAEATAVKLNCSDDEVQVIRWAALLHDIGKIGVPDSILRKAGPLTEDEWEVMRRHPIVGADIIAPVKKLEPVTEIIRHHQEKFDGTGYPDGLIGEEIPLASRILTVVDAYGAMTDDRVFRKALSKEEAAAELLRCSGTHFDQAVVNVFFQLIDTSPQIAAD
ncbi:MAG TPA: HD domain-containing phosphohydrolase [Anaerolineaceae bacterium]|nr:HD domain-containing phosphohydrolase [Anaerolineaceae bacterium]